MFVDGGDLYQHAGAEVMVVLPGNKKESFSCDKSVVSVNATSPQIQLYSRAGEGCNNFSFGM